MQTPFFHFLHTLNFNLNFVLSVCISLSLFLSLCMMMFVYAYLCLCFLTKLKGLEHVDSLKVILASLRAES